MCDVTWVCTWLVGLYYIGDSHVVIWSFLACACCVCAIPPPLLPAHTSVFIPSQSIQICGQVRGAMSVSTAMLVSGGGVGVCFFYLLYSIVMYHVELVFLLGFFQEFFSRLGFPLVIFPVGWRLHPPKKKNWPLARCKLLFNCVELSVAACWNTKCCHCMAACLGGMFWEQIFLWLHI